MRVDVYNRYQAEELQPREDTVVISVTSPGGPLANLKGNWEAILRLQFDDVVCSTREIPDLALFTKEHALTIQNFVKEHQQKNFVIHCEAGVSRSVAIGLYLRDIYKAQLTTHATHTVGLANSRVHWELMRAHWFQRLQTEKGNRS